MRRVAMRSLRSATSVRRQCLASVARTPLALRAAAATPRPIVARRAFAATSVQAQVDELGERVAEARELMEEVSFAMSLRQTRW